MEKTTIYGLPLNPMPALEQLRGASFCVSFGTRKKLGKQLEQAIELVGDILLVDNGAFTTWKNGGRTYDEAMFEQFADWASDILDRSPQAVAVVPDVIGGSVEQNAELVDWWLGTDIDAERSMAIWHLHEPISYLLHLCESFGYIGFGSTVDAPGSDKWHARIREAFAAIDAWEVEGEGAYVRPRIHMMRAQAEAHKYAFDSSDSSNLAVNHNRQFRKTGQSIAQQAARIDGRIQATAGAAAEHQTKRPLKDHLEATDLLAAAAGWDMLQAANHNVEVIEMSESHRINDPLQAKAFVLGGEALFTIVSTATGTRFTYKVTASKDRSSDPTKPPARSGVFFVSLLSGPDNTSDYSYLGIIPKDDPLTFRLTAKSRAGEGAPSVRAFSWLWRQLGQGRLPASVEFWHEGRCGRCGRTLTDPVSIASGFGPICRGQS